VRTRELPPPLPPGERTVGQVVAETIRAYGDRFWRVLPLGIPVAVVDQLSVRQSSGLQMLAGAAVTFGEALVVGEPAQFDPSTVAAESWLAVAYLVVFGSMLAYTAYGWLLRNAPLSLVGTYAYVNPIVAVALGTVFLHEPISVRTLVAAAIILVAVAIIVTARGRLGSSTAPEPAAEIDAPDPGRGGRSEATA